MEALESKMLDAQLVARVRKKEKTLDMEYLMSEIPRAIEQSLEGIDRA